MAPPTRLLSRVLRTVSPEGSALRRESARSRRAVALQVAAAVLVWAGAAVVGLRGVPGPAPAGVPPSGAPPAAGCVGAPAIALAIPTLPAVDVTLAPPPARLGVALALLERIPTLHLDVLDDDAAAALAATLATPRGAGGFTAAAVLDPNASLPAIGASEPERRIISGRRGSRSARASPPTRAPPTRRRRGSRCPTWRSRSRSPGSSSPRPAHVGA